jgi:hypothetical protein
MTAVEEQQIVASLNDISQNMKALLALTKDMAREQEKANEKSFQQLLNIAHKR